MGGRRAVGFPRGLGSVCSVRLSVCLLHVQRSASAGVLAGEWVVRSDKTRAKKKEGGDLKKKGGCNHKWENKVRRGVGGSWRGD